MLNVLDEFTWEYPAIHIARKRNSTAVIDVRHDLFILWGPPGYVYSDNGPDFLATAEQERNAAERLGIRVGSLTDMNVLEHGPLDGQNSAQLEKLGASSIIAVVSNKIALLKRLVSEEILGLERCRFL